MPVVLVFLGGGLGSLLRYLVIQQWVTRIHPSVFPLGTMLVNIVGSLLIGILMAKFVTQENSDTARLFFVTGILGGFTTFSAFSWDAMQLLQRGAFGQAAVYILGSVALSLCAVALGFAIAR